MTEHELKELKNLGAELGAAKAEVERLREELRKIANLPMDRCSTENDYRLSAAKAMALGALSQRAEPVEPAPAQGDGRSAFKAYLDDCAAHDIEPSIAGAFHFAWQAIPAQQPICLPPPPYMPGVEPESMTDYERGEAQGRCDMWEEVKRMNAAPIAQTAPQGKFRMGDLVKKSSGSEWQGHICGTYSTALTPEGYAVESEAHAGSVQIYPAKALEAVE